MGKHTQIRILEIMTQYLFLGATVLGTSKIENILDVTKKGLTFIMISGIIYTLDSLVRRNTMDTDTFKEPTILTANTHFWSPGFHAYERRAREDDNCNTVADYFSRLGFAVSRSERTVTATAGAFCVTFCYEEFPMHVYKSLSITRDLRRSNIVALRNYILRRAQELEVVKGGK